MRRDAFEVSIRHPRVGRPGRETSTGQSAQRQIGDWGRDWQPAAAMIAKCAPGWATTRRQIDLRDEDRKASQGQIGNREPEVRVIDAQMSGRPRAHRRRWRDAISVHATSATMRLTRLSRPRRVSESVR